MRSFRSSAASLIATLWLLARCPINDAETVAVDSARPRVSCALEHVDGPAQTAAHMCGTSSYLDPPIVFEAPVISKLDLNERCVTLWEPGNVIGSLPEEPQMTSFTAELNSEEVALSSDDAGSANSDSTLKTNRDTGIGGGVATKDRVTPVTRDLQPEMNSSNNSSQKANDATSKPALTLKVNDTVDANFKKLGELLKNSRRAFSSHGTMVLVDPNDGLVMVTTKNFSAHCANFFEVKLDEEPKYGVMPQWLINTFLLSPDRVRRSLPPLDFYSRIPVVDLDFNLIATPGYHEESKSYYHGEPIELAEDTTQLDRMLGTFLWKQHVDQVNYLGLLLTAATVQHWPGIHPLAVINGNRPGVGKSLLAKILSVLVDGRTPRSISYNPNDEEFEKQIATRVKVGDNVILIDNAKRTVRVRAVNSGVLERSVTDETLSYRQLGSNSQITRTNTILFCLTMNATTLSADLARRALPINLEGTGDVRHHQFEIPDVLAFVKENRNKLLSELIGLIDRWVRAGRPMPATPMTHSVGNRWAATIDAILQHNGYLGFLTNLDDRAFDDDFSVMAEICAAHWKRGSMAPNQWAGVLSEDLLKHRLTDQGQPKPERSQATIVGQLFRRFAGETFDVDGVAFELRMSDPGKRHASRQYCFKPLEPADADLCAEPMGHQTITEESAEIAE